MKRYKNMITKKRVALVLIAIILLSLAVMLEINGKEVSTVKTDDKSNVEIAPIEKVEAKESEKNMPEPEEVEEIATKSDSIVEPTPVVEQKIDIVDNEKIIRKVLVRYGESGVLERKIQCIDRIMSNASDLLNDSMPDFEQRVHTIAQTRSPNDIKSTYGVDCSDLI